jgi:hypothetical protein
MRHREGARLAALVKGYRPGAASDRAGSAR